jgi:malonyl CoA-acyl carrier protein transacylase
MFTEMLARQLCEPVQWESTIRNLAADGKSKMFELGPGTQVNVP